MGGDDIPLKRDRDTFARIPHIHLLGNAVAVAVKLDMIIHVDGTPFVFTVSTQGMQCRLIQLSEKLVAAFAQTTDHFGIVAIEKVTDRTVELVNVEELTVAQRSQYPALAPFDTKFHFRFVLGMVGFGRNDISGEVSTSRLAPTESKSKSTNNLVVSHEMPFSEFCQKILPKFFVS